MGDRSEEEKDWEEKKRTEEESKIDGKGIEGRV